MHTARAGALGRLRRPGLRDRRQHPADPDYGRRYPHGVGGIRHRDLRQLAVRPRLGVRVGRHAVPDSGGRIGPSARRPRVCELDPRGGRAGAPARRVLRHCHRVHRHWLDARGHDRRYRAQIPRRPADHRHRRLEDASEDVLAGLANRAGDRGEDRCGPRAARRRGHFRAVTP